MQLRGEAPGRRPRARIHRVAVLATTAALTLTALVAPGSAAPAVAANGLTEESHARYVVGAKGKVTASVTTTFTNVQPDTGSTYYYWDSYAIPVPASADDVTATSNGTPLTVRLRDAEDPNTKVAEVGFAPLRHGRTRTIEWTYRIAGNPVRDERWARVGPGYATLPVQAWGDDGRTSVVVDAPTAMTFDATDEFDATPGDERTTYTIEANNTDGGIWAAVSLRSPEKSDEREVALDRRTTITLEGLPGDSTWLDFAADRIEVGMPELERLIGWDWPTAVDVVREDVSPQVLGYAWFDEHSREIVVGEELDEATLYHELGHAWFDDDRFDGRWLYEGLTEVTAFRVVDAVDGEGTPREEPRRHGDQAFPLLEWADAAWDREADDYGYPAAYTAVLQVLGDLDDETFTAVVSAAYAGEDAYAPPGTARSGRDVDWRQFLDLAAERGGVDATDVFRTWVVNPEDEPLLDERTAARQAYGTYDEADGSWQPPHQVRRAMSTWRFADATGSIESLAQAAPAAVAVQDAATATGLPVPWAVRDAYETVEDADHAALPALLAQAAATIDEVGAASDVVAAEGDVVTELGESVLGADGTAADARATLADGDLDAAQALAAETQTAADRALWVGIAVILAALVLLALLVAVPVLLVRRARRRRRPVLTAPQVIAVIAAPDPDRALS